MGTLIRLVAIVACLIVGLSFAMFAVDEAGKGSQTQQQALGRELGEQPAGSADVVIALNDERAREEQHGTPREWIDDADDVLVAPFNSLVSPTDNVWVQRGLPTLLALLLYGVGLGMLANFLPKQRASDGDWRTA